MNDRNDLPVQDMRAMERHTAQFYRAAQQHDFETEDDLADFVERFNAGQVVLDAAPQTPLERAQELMYDAFEASGGKRVQLARQALEISPDCADAYVLLAEETAEGPGEALKLYEQGVAAAERALGPNATQEYADLFWGAVVTRPYMRARYGLAQALAALGREPEAITHYQALLTLNPGDNQGVRYPLLTSLVAATRDTEAWELVRTYPDEMSATWLYSCALLKFRRDGDALFSTRTLGAAIAGNPWVPTYLLGVEPMPESLPPYVGVGDESEAIWCAVTIGKGWFQTPGAMEWLAKTFGAGFDGLPHPERGDGPAFFLNPHAGWGLTRCPACNALTKVRKRYLALTLEPDTLITITVNARMCDDCDLLFLHQRDVIPAIEASARERTIALIDQDFVLLGVVDRAAFTRRRSDDADEQQRVLAHLHRFREERLFDYDPYGWYSDEALLEEAGALLNDPEFSIQVERPPLLPGS